MSTRLTILPFVENVLCGSSDGKTMKRDSLHNHEHDEEDLDDLVERISMSKRIIQVSKLLTC